MAMIQFRILEKTYLHVRMMYFKFLKEKLMNKHNTINIYAKLIIEVRVGILSHVKT